MKKSLIFSFLISVGIVFVTCSSGDDPGESTTTTLFTISQTADAFKYPDLWYVAWDESGKLLDYKKSVDGQTVTLTTTEQVSGKITLGRFKHYPSGSKEKTTISIITDLEIGKMIVYDATTQPREISGTFNLTVDTLNTIHFAASSKYGESDSGGSNRAKFAADIDIPVGEKKFLVTLNEVPDLYAVIDNVMVGDKITLKH